MSISFQNGFLVQGLSNNPPTPTPSNTQTNSPTPTPSVTPTPTPSAVVTNNVLLENGGYLLQEDNSKIIL
jgi:hypothetical protein